jgi:hydrogenase expression/formation protein HypD
LMEVCGTHTMAIHRSGIKSVLPENIRLISGPGCPVCVTPNEYMDRAISLSLAPGVLVTSFGDMLRVPGSTRSLEQARAMGGKVRMVYSPLDALKLADENPEIKVVFLAVGFETTSPTIAATLAQAGQRGNKNFFVLVGHKLVPPAMKALVDNQKVAVSGFICPAHVSAIIGARPYRLLAEKYRIPCVVAGFEPIDVLQGILMLVEMIVAKKPEVKNQYLRVVTEAGNEKAQEILAKTFEPEDSNWRGLGTIPQSGYRLRPEFSGRDAQKMIPVEVEPTREHKGCKCGEVLQGLIEPRECPLYANPCTPEKPVGPCMVSSEGTCAAYYKYVGVGN